MAGWGSAWGDSGWGDVAQSVTGVLLDQSAETFAPQPLNPQTVTMSFIDAPPFIFQTIVRRQVNPSAIIDQSAVTFAPVSVSVLVTGGGAFQEDSFQFEAPGGFQVNPNSLFIDQEANVFAPHVTAYVQTPGLGVGAFQDDTFQDLAFQEDDGGLNQEAETIAPLVTLGVVGAITVFTQLLDQSAVVFGAIAAPTVVEPVPVASGSGAPDLPVNRQVGDILLLFTQSWSGDPVIPALSGWTELTGSPKTNSSTLNGSSLGAFWRRCDGTEVSPLSIPNPGDHRYAVVLAVRGCVASGSPFGDIQGGVNELQTTSFTIPGISTTGPQRLIVFAIARGNDLGDSEFSGWTNANLSALHDDWSDGGSTTGLGGGLVVTAGTKITTGAVGDTTVNISSSVRKAYLTFALRPFEGISINESVAPGLIDQSAATFAPGGGSVVSFGGTVAWDSPDVTWDDAGVVWDSAGGGGGLLDQSATTFAPSQISRRLTFSLLDQSAVLFTPSVAAKTVTATFIDQTAVLFAPQATFKPAFPLIDNEAEPFEFDNLKTLQELTPGLIDQTAVGIAPAVNPKLVETPFVDNEAVAFGPAQFTFSITIGLLDQSAEAIAPFLGPVVYAGLIDQSAVTFIPSLERVLPALIDNSAETFAPENVVQKNPQSVRLDDDISQFLDQSAVTFDPEVFLAPARDVIAELLDQSAVTFQPRVHVPTRPTIVLRARYDPVTIKHARYDPVTLKHAQESRQG